MGAEKKRTLAVRLDYWLNGSSRGGGLIALLILTSLTLVVLQTELRETVWIEQVLYAIGVFFLFEYIARIYAAPISYPDKDRPRIYYITSVDGMIDLVAALPVLIAPLVQSTSAIRVLRLMRLAQLFKVRPIRNATLAVVAALKDSWDELLFSFVLSFALILIGATAMYFVEGASQPEAYGSIPRAMWWSMATLTTVGYGDVYPLTWLGKMIASFLALVGIAAVAMPAGILAAAFSDTHKMSDNVFDSKPKDNVSKEALPDNPVSESFVPNGPSDTR